MKHFFLYFLILSVPGSFAQNKPNSEQYKAVDFIKLDAEISFAPRQKKVFGNLSYTFNVLASTDSIYLDAKNMEFNEVILNGNLVNYVYEKDRLFLLDNFKPSENNILKINYSVSPTQALYFINWDMENDSKITSQIWTQGQGKYTSNWLPSFDDMREKVIFNFKINFDKNYQVNSNGSLLETKKLNDTVTQWNFSMKKPMSSYLAALAIGKYEVQKSKSASNVPLFFYYSRGNENLVEPTYRYTAKMMDILEKEIGLPFPWENYKQTPVQDFLYSGMENTTNTIFSESLMTDSIGFNDRNYVFVNSHEMAHQWFGDLITEDNGADHWLQEGFATYYSQLVEKELFGEDYFYWKLYQSAEQLKAESDAGDGEMVVGVHGSSLTYYQKGAWTLHILRDLIGDNAFESAIKSYLLKYGYQNVSTKDFINEVKRYTEVNLENFEKDWLYQKAFQSTQALNYLKESNFIKNYLNIAALRPMSLEEKYQLLEKALKFPVNEYIGQEVVLQLSGYQTPEALKLYKKAFETGNLYVRQAIALNMEKIPQELKNDFVRLLDDKSYLTIETALYKLWSNFPDEAAQWLEKTRGIDGFYDKNVRMMWLTINLVSPQVDPESTSDYFSELSGYTNNKYGFEIRENAFGYLFQLNTFTNQNLQDLVKGGQHPTSRFRDFSRKLLDKLLEDPEYHQKYVDLMPDLSKDDQEFLSKRIN